MGTCVGNTSYLPGTSDNCGVTSFTQSSGGAINGSFPVGSSRVSFAVRDAANNSNQCSFKVTVFDRDAPVINCGSNMSVNTDAGHCSAFVNYPTPTASDNCAGMRVFRQSDYQSKVFPVGESVDDWLAFDASGNLATCSISITVTDTEAPTVGKLRKEGRVRPSRGVFWCMSECRLLRS